MKSKKILLSTFLTTLALSMMLIAPNVVFGEDTIDVESNKTASTSSLQGNKKITIMNNNVVIEHEGGQTVLPIYEMDSIVEKSGWAWATEDWFTERLSTNNAYVQYVYQDSNGLLTQHQAGLGDYEPTQSYYPDNIITAMQDDFVAFAVSPDSYGYDDKHIINAFEQDGYVARLRNQCLDTTTKLNKGTDGSLQSAVNSATNQTGADLDWYGDECLSLAVLEHSEYGESLGMLVKYKLKALEDEMLKNQGNDFDYDTYYTKLLSILANSGTSYENRIPDEAIDALKRVLGIMEQLKESGACEDGMVWDDITMQCTIECAENEIIKTNEDGSMECVDKNTTADPDPESGNGTTIIPPSPGEVTPPITFPTITVTPPIGEEPTPPIDVVCEDGTTGCTEEIPDENIYPVYEQNKQSMIGINKEFFGADYQPIRLNSRDLNALLYVKNEVKQMTTDSEYYGMMVYDNQTGLYISKTQTDVDPVTGTTNVYSAAYEIGGELITDVIISSKQYGLIVFENGVNPNGPMANEVKLLGIGNKNVYEVGGYGEYTFGKQNSAFIVSSSFKNYEESTFEMMSALKGKTISDDVKAIVKQATNKMKEYNENSYVINFDEREVNVTINFNTAEGIQVNPVTKTVTINEKGEIINDATKLEVKTAKPGFAFAGWYATPDYKQLVANEDTLIRDIFKDKNLNKEENRTITLYAKWVEESTAFVNVVFKAEKDYYNNYVTENISNNRTLTTEEFKEIKDNENWTLPFININGNTNLDKEKVIFVGWLASDGTLLDENATMLDALGTSREGLVDYINANNEKEVVIYARFKTVDAAGEELGDPLFNITLNCNVGEGYNTIYTIIPVYENRDRSYALPVPELDNLDFGGWYTANGKEITNNNVFDAFDKVEKDAVADVYAKWYLPGTDLEPIDDAEREIVSIGDTLTPDFLAGLSTTDLELIWEENGYAYYVQEGVLDKLDLKYLNKETGEFEVFTVYQVINYRLTTIEELVEFLTANDVYVTKVFVAQNVTFEIVTKNPPVKEFYVENLTKFWEDANYHYAFCKPELYDNTFIIQSNGLKYTLDYVLKHNIYTIDELIDNGLQCSKISKDEANKYDGINRIDSVVYSSIYGPTNVNTTTNTKATDKENENYTLSKNNFGITSVTVADIRAKIANKETFLLVYDNKNVRDAANASGLLTGASNIATLYNGPIYYIAKDQISEKENAELLMIMSGNVIVPTDIPIEFYEDTRRTEESEDNRKVEQIPELPEGELIVTISPIESGEEIGTIIDDRRPFAGLEIGMFECKNGVCDLVESLSIVDVVENGTIRFAKDDVIGYAINNGFIKFIDNNTLVELHRVEASETEKVGNISNELATEYPLEPMFRNSASTIIFNKKELEQNASPEVVDAILNKIDVDSLASQGKGMILYTSYSSSVEEAAERTFATGLTQKGKNLYVTIGYEKDLNSPIHIATYGVSLTSRKYVDAIVFDIDTVLKYANTDNIDDINVIALVDGQSITDGPIEEECVEDEHNVYACEIVIDPVTPEFPKECTETNVNGQKLISCEEIGGYVLFKPIIYLYPEKDEEVNVTLDFDGEFISTYPTYEDGWNVIAKPDGTLVNTKTNEEYPYLFYDAQVDIEWDLSKGFCVKGSETKDFLIEKLSEMGLNQDEINDFLVFWMPIMKDNEYNLISFQNEIYANEVDLNVNGATVDSQLRVYMVTKPLDAPIDIEPQTFDTFERTGFSVVEWGGTPLN